MRQLDGPAKGGLTSESTMYLAASGGPKAIKNPTGLMERKHIIIGDSGYNEA